MKLSIPIYRHFGRVAQLARALRSHRRGPWFESRHDHRNIFISKIFVTPSLLQNPKLQQSILSLSGWLSLEEGLLLYRLTREKCDKGAVVEIGSFQGKSTVFMGTALKEKKKGKLYAIDPHLGKTNIGKRDYKPTYKIFMTNIHKFGVDPYIVSIRNTSQEAAKKWKRPISLIFIDGLHDYAHALEDISLWTRHLIDGGIIACHDTFCPYPDVFEAFKKEILYTDKYSYMSFTNSILWAVKGKPNSSAESLRYLYNKNLILFAASFWHTKSLPEKMKQFLVNHLKRIIIKKKVLIK